MQKLDLDDLKIIGIEQTTPVYWLASELHPGKSVPAGRLTFDNSGGALATLRQFVEGEYNAGSVFEALEPGMVICLDEGFFILEEGDIPF